MATMFQGVEKASAAFRLMQQMGWEEGAGLGKEGQGMKEHIRVRQKQDTSGIGIDQKLKAQTLWKLNTTEYDNVLKKLKIVVEQKAEDDREEEDHEDKKITATVVHEVKQNDKEEIRVIKATRPQGRYKKREKGKLVGAYSSTDLTAILGGVQAKTEIERKPLSPLSNKVIPEEISSPTIEPCDQASKERSSDFVQEEELGPPSKKVRRAKAEAELEPEPEFEDLPADWWGNKMGFVRAGKLGATSGTLKTERTAFHEKDQEELAKLAHEKATKGKQGLGAADRIKMGKGAGWKGQRKALDVGSDEEADDGHQKSGNSDHQQSPTDAGCQSNEEIELETQTTGIATEETPKSGGCDGKIKTSSWKKVCKQLLREAPLQTLSLKRLEKRFLSTMLTTCGTEVRLDREKLQKSSKFVIEGKKVSLSSA